MKRIFATTGLVLIHLFFLTAGLSAQEEGDLTWPAVKGASGYRVEVMDSRGKIVEDIIVDEPVISLSRFKPGQYKIRITTLDRFRKEAGVTAWTPFTVKRAPEPLFVKLEPDLLVVGQSGVWTLTGAGFMPETTLVLTGGDREWKLSTFKVVSATQITFSVGEPLPVGPYTITLINPAGKTRTVESVLVIRHPDPVIGSVSPASRTVGDTGNLVIEGNGFREGVQLQLDDGIIPRTLELVSAGENRIEALWPGNLPEGRYDIRVVNDQWSSAVKEDSVIVFIATEDTGSVAAGDNDNDPDSDSGTGSDTTPSWINHFSFALGWQCSLVMPNWNELIGPSLAGGHLMIRYRLGQLSFMPEAVHPLGVWLLAGYSHYGTAPELETGTVEMGVFRIVAGVSWDFVFGRFTLAPALGAGLAFSGMTVTDIIDRESEAGSGDPVLSGELWARYRILDFLSVEIGAGYQHQFRAGESLGLVDISLRVVFF